MKKLALGVAVAAMACFAYGDEAAQTPPNNGSKLHQLGRDSKNSLSLVGRDRPGAEKRPDPRAEAREAAKKMSEYDDSLVFIKLWEGEQLTWGELHGEADRLLETSISDLTAAIGKGEGLEEVRLSLYQQAISKLLQSYIRSTLIAQEAKKLGLNVSDEEIAKETEVAKSKLKTDALSNLQKKLLVGGLYQNLYADKVIRPTVKAEDKTVAEIIQRRHEHNLAVPATNALLRAQLEDMRGRLLRNEVAWGEIAEEYSECPDCSDDNGDCGTWEEDEGEDRGEALVKLCFSIPTNTVSEIVETDDAFHIVKVTSRYEPDAKAREEDGEVSTADVRHIQIDKWEADEEFTEQTAREFIENRLVRRALKNKQNELIEAAKIESVIPLKSGKKGQGTMKVFNKR